MSHIKLKKNNIDLIKKMKRIKFFENLILILMSRRHLHNQFISLFVW